MGLAILADGVHLWREDQARISIHGEEVLPSACVQRTRILNGMTLR